MKRILFIFSLSVLSYALIVQIEPSKRCPTCGWYMAKCQYKSKHPRPKCSTCGKLLTDCQYKGTHPTPSLTKPMIGIINGHEWVNLGLSVKWATCNVGASGPSDYGGYYVWGETRTKSCYEWDNCFDCLDSKGDRWGIYNIGSLVQIVPTSGHDAASENWGGTWRMPTISELDELCTKCKWIWTNRDGHHGYTVIGPNGNSIFFPAAGYRYGTDSYHVGEYGDYWSNAPYSSFSNYARSLSFNSGYHGTYLDYRYFSQSVRPVTE